jgi:malate dehydrogenase (oxaloacetate-decarboxylating)(NADP+)
LHEDEKVKQYGELFWQKRQRKGVTLYEARKMMCQRGYFGNMMVETGDADALITGLTVKYSAAVKPIMEVIGTEPGSGLIAGMYILLTKKGPLFVADTTINENPTAEDIVQITLNTAKAMESTNLTPRVALLSFSNFGSHSGVIPQRMHRAAEILRKEHPYLVVDGEMQANFAMDNKLLTEVFPFSNLVGKRPNVFIFPDLASGNIAYKLLQSFGALEAIGPMLIGVNKSAHVLQMGSSVRDILNMSILAVVDAQNKHAN